MDHIIIGAKTTEECRENLYKVLERLSNYNVKINPDKCNFLKQSIDLLGFVLDKNRLKPFPEKVAAVKNAPRPQDVI